MRISRRSLLLAAGPALPAKELRCDIAVIGGGTGGCAAALAGLRNGMRVILTEETRWIGGQLTSQAVPPDEHRWIETHGATRSYRDYRDGVRAYYRRHYPLTAEARAQWNLNPGGGSVSRLTHEPRVSLAVLEAMLAPYQASGQLVVFGECRPVAADTQADMVRFVQVRGRNREHTITAAYFLDATELGDLLPLTGTEYVTGFESQKDTGEPHASSEAQPANMQAFTVCFAMDYLPGEDHTIEKPEEYGFWRDYVPQLRPAWPGKLLDFTTTHPITLQPRTHPFDPECDSKGSDGGLWTYRRIARQRHYTAGPHHHDMTLVNWPQNDYLLGNLCEAPPAEVDLHVKRAKQLSLSLLYWMQTERGWKGLRLRGDVCGTEDGLAMAPYVRESRRIRAEFTVAEQHVAAAIRKERAEQFRDSVGVGSYRIDLHPSTGGDNYIDVGSHPFQIPLGSLIPRRVENLLPACKNLGVTHITNGCYRLHPVEWNIGESAGLLAAQAIVTRQAPRRIRNTPRLLEDFQRKIQDQGVEIAWPNL